MAHSLPLKVAHSLPLMAHSLPLKVAHSMLLEVT
jgi:hypothetical protein